MQSQVKELLQIFDVLNINIAAVGLPLQCLGLESYEYTLAFTITAPVVLAVALVLVFLLLPYLQAIVARDSCWYRQGKPKARLFAALPWLLMLSFLVFPMVSSSAFHGGACGARVFRCRAGD